jgi:uncharacterized membrane protein
MKKTRLEAFSDGVFAIVITLLVLELKPEGGGSGWQMFLHIWPKLVVYALSFVLVGLYWVAHHNMLHFVEKTDRGFLWLNLLLLMVVAFIPYPTALLGATHADESSIWIYGVTLALTNIVGTGLWYYAARKRRLVSAGLSEEFVRFVYKLHLGPVLIYGVAMAMAPLWRPGSLVLIALVPLFYILPNPFLEKRIAPIAALQRGEG